MNIKTAVYEPKENIKMKPTGKDAQGVKNKVSMAIPKFKSKVLINTCEPINMYPRVEPGTLKFYDFEKTADQDKANPFIVYLDKSMVEEATQVQQKEFIKGMTRIILKCLAVLFGIVCLIAIIFILVSFFGK